MSIVTEAEQVSQIAFGYMGSKALFAALHIDLFTLLSGGPLSPGEASARLELPENRVTTLMTALAGIGLLVAVRPEDGQPQFSNAPGAEAFLVRGAPYDFGDYLRYQIDRQMYPFMSALDDVVQDRMKPDAIDSYADWMDDPDQARIYSEAQHSGSLGPGKSLARLVDLCGVDHLLDIAGGTGAMAIRLCEAWPDLRVTIIDFPNVADLGHGYVERAGLNDRISFQPGNALDTEWPPEAGAVLMSYLFSGVPGDAIAPLVERAYQVLTAKGLLLVHDFMVDDDRAGPPLAALWQLQHMTFTPDARSVTPGWLGSVMTGAGFDDVESHVLIPGMTRLVSARKPA